MGILTIWRLEVMFLKDEAFYRLLLFVATYSPAFPSLADLRQNGSHAQDQQLEGPEFGIGNQPESELPASGSNQLKGNGGRGSIGGDQRVGEAQRLKRRTGR